jgi:hypothetical protein
MPLPSPTPEQVQRAMLIANQLLEARQEEDLIKRLATRIIHLHENRHFDENHSGINLPYSAESVRLNRHNKSLRIIYRDYSDLDWSYDLGQWRVTLRRDGKKLSTCDGGYGNQDPNLAADTAVSQMKEEFTKINREQAPGGGVQVLQEPPEGQLQERPAHHAVPAQPLTDPRVILPPQPQANRELVLVNASKYFWNLRPTATFYNAFPTLRGPCDVRIALLQKDKRGLGPEALETPLAADGRSLSLQRAFPQHPSFVNVRNAFTGLPGFRQMPRAKGAQFTSPCAGGPFFGTVGGNQVDMTLRDMLLFFRNLGFTVYIDTGYHQEYGPVRTSLPNDIWEEIVQISVPCP